MILGIFFIIALALMTVAWLPALPLDGLARLALSTIGFCVGMVAGIVAIVTRLYRKVPANMAVVRTGMGGTRIIRNGGSLVFPTFHEVVRVSLETMSLEVNVGEADAVADRSGQRLCLAAQFYAHVSTDLDSILLAARSLGERTLRPADVGELLRGKLVTALRIAALEMDATEAEAAHDLIAERAKENAHPDFTGMGMHLDSVTITMISRASRRADLANT